MRASGVVIYVKRRMLHCSKSAQICDPGASATRPRFNQAERGVHVIWKKHFDFFQPSPARTSDRRRGAVGDRDARAERVGAAVSDGGGEYDRPCGHRHRGHRRHPAFGHRHHGDQRDRLGAGREARDRADQRRRRRARAQDQVHPGGRRQRLADLRREGEEAPGQRQGRVGDGLLDLGVAQGGAAGVRAVQRHALLPDLLRRPRASKNVIYTGQEATQQIIAGLDWVQKEKGAKTFYLLGSDYIWPRTSNKIARKHIENFLKLQGGRRGVLPARPHAVQLGHQQDQARASRT